MYMEINSPARRGMSSLYRYVELVACDCGPVISFDLPMLLFRFCTFGLKTTVTVPRKRPHVSFFSFDSLAEHSDRLSYHS